MYCAVTGAIQVPALADVSAVPSPAAHLRLPLPVPESIRFYSPTAQWTYLSDKRSDEPEAQPLTLPPLRLALSGQIRARLYVVNGWSNKAGTLLPSVAEPDVYQSAHHDRSSFQRGLRRSVCQN
jgi:hypothetical protein